MFLTKTRYFLVEFLIYSLGTPLCALLHRATLTFYQAGKIWIQILRLGARVVYCEGYLSHSLKSASAPTRANEGNHPCCKVHPAVEKLPYCVFQSRERREAVRQTWARRTLQRHANVDVRFILAQPDLPVGSHLGGLGSSAGSAEATIEAAYRVLEVKMLLATISTSSPRISPT